jgi:endonuclease/exonuclease/phosphatase family metal-dependent hydrolase
MHGREYTGSVAGRTAISAALVDLRLTVPTEYLPHRIPELLSIDHIAVPESAKIHSTTRIIAQAAAGNRLSDHDAYTTEVRLA